MVEDTPNLSSPPVSVVRGVQTSGTAAQSAVDRTWLQSTPPKDVKTKQLEDSDVSIVIGWKDNVR